MDNLFSNHGRTRHIWVMRASESSPVYRYGLRFPPTHNPNVTRATPETNSSTRPSYVDNRSKKSTKTRGSRARHAELTALTGIVLFSLRFLCVLITGLLTASPSSACISGRGTELRDVLNAEVVFRGELLSIGPIIALEDDYFEQTLSFRIIHSFTGPISEREVRDISFQYPFNPSEYNFGDRSELRLGEGYTVVLNRLRQERPKEVDSSARPPDTVEDNRVVHRWHRFACGGDGLSLRKNSHDHAKSIWFVFKGHSHTPELRADVLTEFFGINGRF